MKVLLYILTHPVAIYKGVKEILDMLKTLDKTGVERFSPEWADTVRAYLIYLVWRMRQGEHIGWRKYIETDDAFGACCTRILQSGRLEKLLSSNTSTLDRQQIIKQLREAMRPDANAV